MARTEAEYEGMILDQEYYIGRLQDTIKRLEDRLDLVRSERDELATAVAELKETVTQYKYDEEFCRSRHD